MRLRKRHAWSAVLVGLFVLPLVKPEGFPGAQGWGDAALSWPARSDVANPHSWLANRASTGPSDDAAVRAVEQILLEERQRSFEEREALMQRLAIVEAHQASSLDRLPRTLSARVLRAHDASPRRKSILVDRGSTDGVVEGLAVSQGRVLVGTVQRAQGRSARVKCVTDPESRVEVAVLVSADAGGGEPRPADQRAVAFLYGGGDPERLALRFAKAGGSRPIRPGDPVVTGNGDERIPAGLLVGYVVETSDPDGDGVPDLRVRPLLDLDATTTVTVLLPGA
jgi:rod shape-determining protein MreC